jgi:hypothetical protein
MRRDSKAKGDDKGGDKGGQKGGEKGADVGVSPARRRTLERMQRLLAAGVAAGGLGTGCWENDSLPPPLDCASDPTSVELQRCCLHPQAIWVLLEEELVVRIEMSLWWAPEPRPLVVRGDPAIQGGELVNLTLEESQLTFRLRPTPGLPAVEVALPLACDGYELEIRFRLDTSASPVQGQALSVTPLD